MECGDTLYAIKGCVGGQALWEVVGRCAFDGALVVCSDRQASGEVQAFASVLRPTCRPLWQQAASPHFLSHVIGDPRLSWCNSMKVIFLMSVGPSLCFVGNRAELFDASRSFGARTVASLLESRAKTLCFHHRFVVERAHSAVASPPACFAS